MAEPAKPAKVLQDMELRIKWGAGSELDPIFADQMHLARLHDQFYLTFGQVRVTSAPMSSEEANETEIRPVVRLVIPKEAMGRLVTLLQGGLAQE